jgi:7-cyano-7-deazaguanine synthase
MTKKSWKPRPGTCIVLLSGGIDSTTLLAHMVDKEKRSTSALYVNYARWLWESKVSRELAAWYGVPFSSVIAACLETKPGDNFIAVRNAHLLTVAANIAYVNDIESVAIGSTSGEYSDQSGEFIDRFNFMLDYCFESSEHPWVLAPFCGWTKQRVFKYAKKLGVPLDLTVSCYEDPPCGKCAVCRMRLEGGLQVERRLVLGKEESKGVGT